LGIVDWGLVFSGEWYRWAKGAVRYRAWVDLPGVMGLGAVRYPGWVVLFFLLTLFFCVSGAALVLLARQSHVFFSLMKRTKNQGSVSFPPACSQLCLWSGRGRTGKARMPVWLFFAFAFLLCLCCWVVLLVRQSYVHFFLDKKVPKKSRLCIVSPACSQLCLWSGRGRTGKARMPRSSKLALGRGVLRCLPLIAGRCLWARGVVFSSNTDLLHRHSCFPCAKRYKAGGWGSPSDASGTICLPALRLQAAFSTPARH